MKNFEEKLQKTLDLVEKTAGKKARDKYEKNARNDTQYAKPALSVHGIRHDGSGHYSEFFTFDNSPEGLDYWNDIWAEIIENNKSN